MSKILAVFILAISIWANAQTWIQHGDDIECPDVLNIQGESYIIFNDCYGFDPKEPIIETGKIAWEGDYISFLYRKVRQRSFLQGDAKSQKLKVLKNNGSELHLQDESRVFKFKISNAKE